MAQKKNKSRKALAVALGIMGVAGLSVASASQLTITAENEVGVGVDTFSSCQTSAISVDYTYDAGTLVLEDLTLDSIDAACVTAGADITVTLDWNDGAAQSQTFGPTAATAGVFTVDISGESIAVADDLGDVTVIID